MAAISKVLRLSQKLRGAERSMLTLCIGFVGRRFQKKYRQKYHTILSDIVNPILQNGGHFQSNTSISEPKRRRASKGDSMYRCGAKIPEKKTYCLIHHAIISAILQKMAAREIFENMRQRIVRLVSTYIIF